MFDMGPYYLTALVNLIGPVRRVTGSARITFPQRTITSEPLNGTVIDVEVPTHVAGVMDFENGAIGTIIQSFDVSGHSLPNIQIHGSEGSLWVPDPNSFGGPVRLYRNGEWEEVPLTHGYIGNSSRRRHGRYGAGDEQQPSAPRQRCAGLPRTRPDARLPRRQCRRPPHRNAEHLRASRAAATGLQDGELDD
jgi:predicted dehydrogenase